MYHVFLEQFDIDSWRLDPCFSTWDPYKLKHPGEVRSPEFQYGLIERKNPLRM
jgi:hypothetical protein